MLGHSCWDQCMYDKHFIQHHFTATHLCKSTKGNTNEQNVPTQGSGRSVVDHDYHTEPTPSWRKTEWRKVKAKEKQELIRWTKNPDHEVQMVEHPRWPWWD